MIEGYTMVIQDAAHVMNGYSPMRHDKELRALEVALCGLNLSGGK